MNIVSIRLNIDGQAYICDCYENESIQITKRAQTIEYVEAAQGVVTKQTFRMPLVGNLVQALGRLDELQIDLPYDIRKNIEGAVLVNDFPRFRGSFNILATYLNPSTGFSEVEMIFKGNETNLKYELTNIYLKDILAGQTIAYNMTQIMNFYDSPSTAWPYAWPLIDYGQQWTNDPAATTGRYLFDGVNQTDFKPAISLREIMKYFPVLIEPIITVHSSADDLLDQYIPLHNNESGSLILDTTEMDGTGRMYLASSYQLLAEAIPLTEKTIAINFDAKEVYDSDHFDITTDEYTVPKMGAYQGYVQANITIDQSTTVDIVRVRIGITVNGVKRVITESNFNHTNETKYFKVPWFDEFLQSDVIKFYFSVESLYTATTADITFTDMQLIISSTPALTLNSKVDVAKNIDPNLTAWDLVKTIATECNGLFVENTEGFEIVPWTEWVKLGEDYDISDMVEHNQQIKIVPTSVEAPKKIRFTFLNDEDTLNKLYTEITGKTYGELLIEDTGTDFGTETKEITVPFAATPLAYIDQSNLIIPKFINNDGKVIKTKPRLLKLSNVVMPANIPFTDITTGATDTINGVPFFGHWEDPEGGWDLNDYNWGTNPNFFASQGYPNNTLYVRFWEQYIIETYGINARKLEMGIHITQNQFDKLKLNERVYWNGNILRFTAINNFDVINEGVTQAVLVYRATIEKIDIAPYYPYDVINSVVQWKDSSDNSVVASPLAAELEESAAAYGFYYDATNNRAIQSGQLLTT